MTSNGQKHKKMLKDKTLETFFVFKVSYAYFWHFLGTRSLYERKNSDKSHRTFFDLRV